MRSVDALEQLVEQDTAHRCPGFGEHRVCVRAVAVADLPTRYGRFRILAFRNERDAKEHIAIIRGNLVGAADVPTRLHSERLTGDAIGSLRCDCRDARDAATARPPRDLPGEVGVLHGRADPLRIVGAAQVEEPGLVVDGAGEVAEATRFCARSRSFPAGPRKTNARSPRFPSAYLRR
jgi:hypothetical protein